MKDVRKLVPRTPPDGLLEWAAGTKEELDEDVLLIETEWAEDYRLEVILDEWAQEGAGHSGHLLGLYGERPAVAESGRSWGVGLFAPGLLDGRRGRGRVRGRG